MREIRGIAALWNYLSIWSDFDFLMKGWRFKSYFDERKK